MLRRRDRRIQMLLAAVLSATSAVVLVANDVGAQDFTVQTTGVLGDRIWLDLDFDGELDAGEIGLAGIDVTVSWNSGTSSTTVTTGSDGTWTVGSLPFDTVLTVTVDDTDLPNNVTPTHDLDDSILSGPIATPHAADVTLTSGAPTNNDLDFGYIGLGSVGDSIWLDIDGDGNSTMESGDVALVGVDILVEWPGPNGGDPLAITVTSDGSGFWNVQGLPGGIVTVTPDPATLPNGVVATYDADGLVNGIATMDINDDPGTVGVNEGTRMNVDFAFAGTGSIGGLVWSDVNADGSNSGESGVAATTVSIEWTDGVTSTVGSWTTDTDGGGGYLAGNLPAGSYRITMPDLVTALWSPTVDPDGVDDGTGNLALTAGQNLLSSDFGWRQVADLSVTAIALNEFRIGEADSFAVQVDNDGPGSAIGPVTVVHDLGPGLTFDGITGPGAAAWTCAADPAPNADIVRCTFAAGDMPVGGSSYSLVVTPGAAAAPEATVRSTISSVSADSNTSDNTHDAAADAPLAELELTMTRLNPLASGALVTYRLGVTNTGPSPTSGAVVVNDDLPDGLLYDDYDGDGWSCAVSSGDVVCVHVGVIPVSATANIDLHLVVTAAPGATIENTATATGGNEVGGTPLDQATVDAEVGAATDDLAETVGSIATTSTTAAPTTTTSPGSGTTTTTTPGATTTTTPGATTTTDGSAGGSGAEGDGSTGGDGDGATDADGAPAELARTGIAEMFLWFTVLALAAGGIMTWATRPLRRPKAGAHWGQ